MDRIYYQNEICDLLDRALNDLTTEEFDKLMNRIEEVLSDYY